MIWLKRKIALLTSLILISAFAFSCKSDTAETDDNSNLTNPSSICKSVESSDDSSLLNFSTDTEKAVKLVCLANGELIRIKILYNENQNTLKDLEEATQKGETERVKIISKTLADTINTGLVFADDAKSRIQKAQELNIHQDYKDYLGLKEQSLDKQVAAFQFLYEAAKLLSETAGSQDKEQAEKARFAFKEKEGNFQLKMEEAKKISAQADDLAKESMQRAK